MLDPAETRHPPRRGSFSVPSGIELPVVAGPREEAAELGFPGEYPFIRGVRPNMYRGRLWTMRQYSGFGSARETNERNRYLLEQGQTGLSVAFDLPTQMGRDSDDEMAAGEVGRVGVAIDTRDDMDVLFDHIPLDRVSTSMTINSTAPILLALYILCAEKQGVARKALRGTVQNDILKEYIARGTYIYPPRPSMRLVTDLMAFCHREVPLWNTISISGYHIREAGSTAVQEVAFTLADGIAYVEAAQAAGLAVDEFAPRLSFFFNAHNNFLEEIAKFRAARRLWARIVKERFGAKDPRSMMLRFHTQTAGCTLTAQQPDNNVVRVTLQALAAVLGGTQSLHTNSRDEALALPTQDSVRIALRTQQIIAGESGVADVVDPLGGSYLVEELTDSIESGAAEYIERIDGLGGMIAAIERGYVQREIQDAAYREQCATEAGDREVVGVNVHQLEEEVAPPLMRVDPRIEKEQVGRLRRFRAARGERETRAALDRIRAAAEGAENLLPPVLEALGIGATLGEVSTAMREVFGVHEEVVVL
ncbi:MAG: methylmalonyl-CoA mutase family protein [Myxococcota bacterium]|nr:methylmalonyl-CoA mutase family protein [Myxococcota bacterium]